MAWLKTIDGDLVNLDSGVWVGIYKEEISKETHVKVYTPGGPGTGACYGTKEEIEQYMKDFEEGLLNADEIIIDPS